MHFVHYMLCSAELKYAISYPKQVYSYFWKIWACYVIQKKIVNNKDVPIAYVYTRNYLRLFFIICIILSALKQPIKHLLALVSDKIVTCRPSQLA